MRGLTSLQLDSARRVRSNWCPLHGSAADAVSARSIAVPTTSQSDRSDRIAERMFVTKDLRRVRSAASVAPAPSKAWLADPRHTCVGFGRRLQTGSRFSTL